MKTQSHRIRDGIAYLILVFMFIATGIVVGAETENESRARDSYEKGLVSYTQKEWNSAIRHFLESFSVIENSNTAYMISVSYMRLRDPEKTIQFAEKSIILRPRLDSTLLGELEKVTSWANAHISYRNNFSGSGKADDPFEASATADMPGPPSPPRITLPVAPLSSIRE